MKQLWKNIFEYEKYKISNTGIIKNIKTNKNLKPQLNKNGYLYVTLKNKKYAIHRLVAIAFLENKNNYYCVNHKDGNKLNNNVDNLEWCTSKYNFDEAVKLGLIKLKYNSYDNKIRAKKVAQYTIDNKFIKTYICSVDAEKELKNNGIKINARNIRKVCLNERKTAGGFIWKYLD